MLQATVKFQQFVIQMQAECVLKSQRLEVKDRVYRDVPDGIKQPDRTVSAMLGLLDRKSVV